MSDPSWSEVATWVGIAIAVAVAVYLAAFRKVERGPSLRPLAGALAVLAGLAVVIIAVWTKVGSKDDRVDDRVDDLSRRVRALERLAPPETEQVFRSWFCNQSAPTEREQRCYRNAWLCDTGAFALGGSCVVSTVAWCGDGDPGGTCYLSLWACRADEVEQNGVRCRAVSEEIPRSD